MKLHVSLISLLLILNTSISKADDYVWGEEFKEGDIISAETFNQIFNTLQKLNRTPVDADLVGTWSCDAVHSQSGLDTTGWTANDFLLTLDNAQLTMTASSQSTSLAQSYSFSTSNPSPFIRLGTNAASSGTYILFSDMLLMKGVMSNSAVSKYQVNIISDDRFILTPLSDGGNYPDLIMCDSAIAVPAAPTATTATNAQTQVNVTWTDNSADETGFKIYRRLSNENEATELATAVTASPYVDSTLTEGQTAYYSVTAYNDNGESAKSKVASATLDTVNPTVVSTSPVNGASMSANNNRYVLTINFSESIIMKSPNGLATCGGLNPITIDGPSNSGNMCGFVDFSGITLSCEPFVGPLGSGIHTVTIDSDFIYDLNDNKMSLDYVFTFTWGL